MRVLLTLTLVQLSCAFYMHTPLTSVSCRPALRNAVTRGKWQMDTKIPDFFPSDWGRRGGGLGEGGVRIPDSFSVDGMEKEKQGGRTAVLERPTQRTDPGKKYKVLLFNDEKNTKEFVIQTLVKFIPGMTAEKVMFQCELIFQTDELRCLLFGFSQAKQVTLEAHQTGMKSCEFHFTQFSVL